MKTLSDEELTKLALEKSKLFAPKDEETGFILGFIMAYKLKNENIK